MSKYCNENMQYTILYFQLFSQSQKGDKHNSLLNHIVTLYTNHKS